MTIQNRDQFLNRIAASLGRPRRTEGVERPKWSVNPQLEVLKGQTQENLIDVLEKQCKIIHTVFKRTDKNGLERVLKETIEAYNGKSIIVPNDPRNEEYGLANLFHEIEQNIETHIWDYKRQKENQIFAERADIGITFSDITLAESATVTLFHHKDHGRTISLLPHSYIAIIPRETIVPRMTQAAQQIHEAIAKGEDVVSCVSFISGPSNSADIEMNLIVGVHGPVHATYIVVD